MKHYYYYFVAENTWLLLVYRKKTHHIWVICLKKKNNQVFSIFYSILFIHLEDASFLISIHPSHHLLNFIFRICFFLLVGWFVVKIFMFLWGWDYIIIQRMWELIYFFFIHTCRQTKCSMVLSGYVYSYYYQIFRVVKKTLLFIQWYLSSCVCFFLFYLYYFVQKKRVGKKVFLVFNF